MKKQFFFTLVVLLSSLYLNAQFLGDMESYTTGEPICSSEPDATWQAWCSPLGEGCCMMATTDQARTGIISGEIPNDGTTSALLNLGNKIFGVWILQFHMYVPSDKEASFNIQGKIPPVGSGHSVVGNINFNKDIANPGVGFIDWNTTDPSDDTYFNFPHDKWFNIFIGVDISMGISIASWVMNLDQVIVVPHGTPFADGNGVHPTSLGGVNFPSVGPNNLYYLDDFCIESLIGGGTASDCFPLSINESDIESFSIYPNPVNELFIIKNSSALKIVNIKLFDILGRVVLEINTNFDSFNVSKLISGNYFIAIETNKGTIHKKVIKI